MNQLEGLLILLVLPLGLLLCGYWLAARLEVGGAATRVAIAMLAGLAVLLLEVTVLNFFVPIAGWPAYACLAPGLFTLLVGANRQRLLADVRTLAGQRPARIHVGMAALFCVLLVSPTLFSSAVVFYEGTSNHDSFFWIASAEYLKRHSYMEVPALNALRPVANAVPSIIGWKPAWGRMGAEGMLALASALTGTSPLKLYLYATACLFPLWLAAMYLAVKTFYAERVSPLAWGAGMLLQPVFVFYYNNSNLPNLLGAITGATAVIAVARVLAPDPGEHPARGAWLLLTVLSLHALYCVYPEMVPFVWLPCSLLWLRSLVVGRLRQTWRPALLVAGAVVVSLLVNLASTVRAVSGFVASMKLARGEQPWSNIFRNLDPFQYPPALITLSVRAASFAGPVLGFGLCLLLLAGVFLAFRRARDRFGYFAAFTGGLVLLVYTFVTGFNYGWQKGVQFSGVFLAATVSVAQLDALLHLAASARPARWLGRIGSAGLTLYLCFALGVNLVGLHYWSSIKSVSNDWFVLRGKSQQELRNAPVLVESASFLLPFFYSMWSAYFLPESNLYYGARGEESGGYLRGNVINEQNHKIPKPAAILVGHDWADAFDANSPRLLTGREYTLLQKNNRVFKLTGFSPINGVPDHVSGAAEMEILPHSPGNLLLELAPWAKTGWPAGVWQLTRHAEGAEDFRTTVSGPSPWHLVIPLVAARRNQVTITLAGHDGPADTVSFAVRSLRIEDSP